MSNPNSYEQDWGDLNPSNSQSDFMKLLNGTNIIRIASKPSTINFHWPEKRDGGKNKVVCIGTNCPLCKVGDVPVKRTVFYVFDRKDENKLKIIEIGPQIANDIKAYAMEPSYGDPQMYDFKIERSGAGRETRYRVIPIPQKKPFSEIERTAIAEAASIGEVFKPKTAEEIMGLDLKCFVNDLSGLDDNFGGFNDELGDVNSDDGWNSL